ncbi:MAG: GyrI-like domain-containing protein [Hyphomicrobiaceae bacterium]|nr:GyrI-like domain-containing protein [Hyphomicrobiaceae bacterium]
MASGFVYLRPTQLIYFRCHGNYAEASAKAWRMMFTWMEKQRLRGVVDRGYGLAHDDPRVVPAAKCRYDACIEMTSAIRPAALDGLGHQRLPSGAYARKRHVGSHDGLADALRHMRSTWSSRHGLEVSPTRPVVELYLDDPMYVRPERLRTDICLPISFASDRIVA